MVNLIGNEIKKVFSKWSVKILMIIAVALMLLQGIIVTFLNDAFTGIVDNGIDEQIAMYEKSLADLDPNDPIDVEFYVMDKTQLEVLKLQKKYQQDEEWKSFYINGKGLSILENYYNAKYGLNNIQLKDAQEEYDKFLETLEKDDWKEYAQETLETSKKELALLKQQKEISKDKLSNQEVKQLNIEIAMCEVSIEELEIRLEKNISYDGSHLSEALETYEDGMMSLIPLEAEDRENLEYNDVLFLDEAKAETMIAKHMLDTGKILNDYDNASSSLETYITGIGNFMFLLIIIVVTSSMISEEFSKGTIKQLLIRPYKRTKIWFSKYIASIIVLIISMLIISIIAIVVFGLFMGFDDYANFEIGVYDYNSGSAFSMNVFAFIGISLINKLPYYIILGTIAIFISTLLKNSAMAVAIPLLGTMVAPIVNQLLITGTKFRFLKYFITPNWDWSVYNFGKKSVFSFIDFKFSIIVSIVWVITLIGIAVIKFKKEDIKNV